ncbi:MAG: ATP-dependent DNA helicase RecG [Chloroflexota bacterium]|nr:MAG: DNA helicase RecG [Chloroflexota bacterium]
MRRVLVLEERQGFADRAALGGLEAFAAEQVARAGSSPLLNRIEGAAQALRAYADVDREQRKSAVERALSALGRRTADEQGKDSPGGDHAAKAATVPGRGGSRAPAQEYKSGPSVVRGPAALDSTVASLNGMRTDMAEALLHVGVGTVRGLIYYFPRTHYDYTDTRSISRMRFGEKSTLVGTIKNVRTNRTRRSIVITTATIADDSGTVAVRWFNQPYLAKNLPVGARIAITGQPDVFNGVIVFQPRDHELIRDVELTHAARLVPIYPLTKGLHQRWLRQVIRKVIEEYAPALEDYLPVDLQRSLDLMPLAQAVRQYHFPTDEGQKNAAQQRLAFDELLLIQLGLLMRKREWQAVNPDVAIAVDQELNQRFRASLPFTLTRAQDRVIRDIGVDIARPVPMARLLQGDVGSGKTVVAAANIVQCVNSGRQAVLMAPTEVLSEQHFRTLGTLLEPCGARVQLLTAGTPQRSRKEILAGVLNGSVDVLVGTHALIQEGVEFKHLGLAITDEQHRFGVEQRATLRQKGLHPHTLAMTATPIPRTLAMTIYGDLDVSALDEMPPGRLPAITSLAPNPSEAYRRVRAEVSEGRQAFVICPVITESMETDMRSVIAEHKELQDLIFPDLRVGLLHGRLKSREKERILQSFREGEIHILVATSVIEVGIDIPNATVIVVRDAHRFGLAQLHQFRGRVGRGGHQGYCVLLSLSEGPETRNRLEALTSTTSGFDLAEIDLRLRGPGEFWGTRQSGLPQLRVATLGDVPTIERARQNASRLLEADPELRSGGHTPLRHQVERFWKETADLS